VVVKKPLDLLLSLQDIVTSLTDHYCPQTNRSGQLKYPPWRFKIPRRRGDTFVLIGFTRLGVETAMGVTVCVKTNNTASGASADGGMMGEPHTTFHKLTMKSKNFLISIGVFLLICIFSSYGLLE